MLDLYHVLKGIPEDDIDEIEYVPFSPERERRYQETLDPEIDEEVMR